MTPARLTTVLLLSLSLSACGSDAGGTGPGGGDDEEPTVTTVTVTPTEVTLEVDETAALEATVLDQDGNAMSASVSWASSDTDVAEVNPGGVVTALAPGEAVVTATADGVTGTADVTVEEPLSPLDRTLEEAREVIEQAIPDPDAPADQRNPAEELDAVARALVELEDILAVRVYANALSLQAVTEEGVTLLFINNRFDGASDDGGASAVETRSAARSAAAVEAAGPPGSRKASVWTIQSAFAEADEVASVLFAGGYNVDRGANGVEDMKASPYTDLGALMIDTHGAVFNEMEVTEDGSGDPIVQETGAQRYGLQTGSYVERGEISTLPSSIRQDIERGDVVLSMSGDNLVWILGITESFIRRYWSFDGGVAMIHACNSGRGAFSPEGQCLGRCVEAPQPPVDPSALREALLDAGADLVVGFDNFTNTQRAQPSRMYFFDRMLGTNMHGEPDPPARPFPAEDVIQGMQDQGLTRFNVPDWVVGDIDLGGNEVDVTFDGDPAAAQLAPTIRHMEVVDDAARDAGELKLFGSFGSERGTVTVDGTELDVVNWAEEKIVANAPFEGSASSGDVQVRSDAEIPSNEAPLTEWTGTLEATYDSHAGDLSATSVVDLAVRADVHPYRTTLPDDPSRPETTAYVSPASEGQTEGQGSHTSGDATTEWYGETETRILEKQEVDAAAAGSAGYDEPIFGGRLTLRPEVNEAELCYYWEGSVNVRETSGQGTREYTFELPFALPDMLGQGQLTCLEMTLTDDYTIRGGSQTWQPEGTEFAIELEWSDLQPTSPPTELTAG